MRLGTIVENYKLGFIAVNFIIAMAALIILTLFFFQSNTPLIAVLNEAFKDEVFIALYCNLFLLKAINYFLSFNLFISIVSDEFDFMPVIKSFIWRNAVI